MKKPNRSHTSVLVRNPHTSQTCTFKLDRNDIMSAVDLIAALDPVLGGQLALANYDGSVEPEKRRRHAGRRSGEKRRQPGQEVLVAVEEIKRNPAQRFDGARLSDEAAVRKYLKDNEENWLTLTAEEHEKRIKHVTRQMRRARSRQRNQKH